MRSFSSAWYNKFHCKGLKNKNFFHRVMDDVNYQFALNWSWRRVPKQLKVCMEKANLLRGYSGITKFWEVMGEVINKNTNVCMDSTFGLSRFHSAVYGSYVPKRELKGL